METEFNYLEIKMMKLEHVAIWTHNLEKLKAYYETYFGGVANTKYVNESKNFQSYFLTFDSGAGAGAGARIEIMTRPDIRENRNDIQKAQIGITHFAFAVETMDEVDEKARQLKTDGYEILSGPRKTGDGYYEFETFDPDNNRLEVTTEST